MNKITRVLIFGLVGAVITPYIAGFLTDISYRKLPIQAFINFKEIQHFDIQEGNLEQTVLINRWVNKTYTDVQFTKSIVKVDSGVKQIIDEGKTIPIKLEKSANGIQTFVTPMPELAKGKYCVGRHYRVLLSNSELNGSPIYRSFDVQDACFNVL